MTKTRRAAAATGPQPEIDRFRAQHLQCSTQRLAGETGAEQVTIDDGESPLAWLARRKGRDGAAMISQTQFIAGERLRADFTRAQMMPRVTSSWEAPTGRRRGASFGGHIADTVIAARQSVRAALDTCGPEFAGLLLDVCCFLRGLEEVERNRGWPSRSAKIVLQLALDRLARHYGLSDRAVGRIDPRLRSWWADDAVPRVD
ncbi:MAG: DNA replication protein [Rhodopseudomonas palustris]|nr:MAG: DNA replication protein [Rhodopseudomonas palustris]